VWVYAQIPEAALTFDYTAEAEGHLVSPEEAVRIAMARQWQLPLPSTDSFG
jgi:hypothetical protein